MKLSSIEFENNGTIPTKYTCDGLRELSPALSITDAPEGVRSFVLTMDDSDIPKVFRESRGTESFDHWILYNIPAETIEIPEGTTTIGMHGLNSSGKEGYLGPCPPPQYEPSEHRYVFTLFALNNALNFDEPPTKQQVLKALNPFVLAKAELIGLYSRK